MGVERLELSRAYKAQRILSPQRLPFRHTPRVVVVVNILSKDECLTDDLSS